MQYNRLVHFIHSKPYYLFCFRDKLEAEASCMFHFKILHPEANQVVWLFKWAGLQCCDHNLHYWQEEYVY